MDISIRSEICRFINFAMQQNYVPVIYSIIVSNNGDEPVEDLTVKICSEPQFADVCQEHISLIEPHRSIEIKPVAFKAYTEFLYTLTEKTLGRITVEVISGEETVAQCSSDIELLAYDEWNGTKYMPEIISAFVIPNHPMISSVLSKAGEYLEQWSGDPSFTGYMTENPNHVRNQAAAIYAALQDIEIAYITPPASFEATGQRVRLAYDVLQGKMGTCLDLTLLFASCLEAVSINPIVILLDSHAFLGVWLESQTFSECALDDESAILKRCADGINEICLIECTDLAAGRSASFEQSERHAKNTLNDMSRFDLAIDVKRCRGGGIRPIPIRVMNNGAYIIADYSAEDSKANKAASAPEALAADNRIATDDQGVNSYLTKQQLWERKLLDLSLRNSLLSFRATKNSVQLMVSDIVSLEDRLASGEAFTVMPQPEDWAKTVKDSAIFDTENDKDLITTISESEFKNKRIRTFVSEAELERACKALYRSAKLSLEENGNNTLYLALGFLKWYETDKSEKARYAPLVLIPIDIVRNVQDKTYKIRLRDEETQMNITLLELLRQDHGIVINGLDPIPSDEHGADVQLVLNTVRHAVMNKKRWDVENYAFIGLFSFSRFIMWNDIRNRSDDLSKNKVVSSLISGKMEWQPIDNDTAEECLDDIIKPSDLAVPSSADSSQLLAIYQASKGQSFVLHGPPGTGKSQTITNMIANALYHDKTVLFVAEKMAALSVVQSRLEKIGLGSFCLELHSNKAQKRAVLSQLEKTLEVGRIRSPESYQETAEKLYSLRCELNGVMQSIHKKRGNGISVYDAVTMFETYSEYKGKIALPEALVAEMSSDSFEKWQSAVKRLKSAAGEFGDISSYALNGYGRRDYSISVRDEFASELARGETLVQELSRCYSQICDVLSIKASPERIKCCDLYELCNILTNCQTLLKGILTGSLDAQRLDYINALISSGKELSELETELSVIFDNTVFGFDAENAKLEWKKASTSWFLAKSMGQSKLLKGLKLHAKNADSVTKDNYAEFIDKLIRRAELQKMITSADSNTVEAIKDVWLGESTNWSVAEKAIADNVRAEEILSKCSISCESFIAVRSNMSSVNDYMAAFSGFVKFDDAFCDKFSVAYSNESWLDECIRRYTQWQMYTDRIREWSQLLCELDSADALGIPQVSEALKAGDVTAEDVYESFMCALGYAVAVHEIKDDANLSSFSGRAFEDNIDRFADITEQFRMLTINELVAKLSAKIPATSGDMAGSSEIGVLLKAIKNGGRMMPIRKLFDSIPLLLHRICPCMLMSPISVAQYIDPKYPKFDLVIFDEASQLPTSEAVGAIARGENVIVVGDPKQLPPTSFFATNHVDEENFEKEDLESVLDDCLAISMPQEHLLWHYRSRHESLIAYSNAKYYDNKLYTFPSPNDLESKVTFVKVDGYYDKGSTKQNRAEAEAIVSEIERRLDDPQLRLESIGIVTFSVAQQSLIDDLLSDKFRERPELEQLAEEMYEPLFVKNLENVQGDERDVILFSVGYGPDKNGKVSMNFGPINRDGGWRRLNVAISRARKCMTVFSTITYDMIDMSRTSSEGVAGLKGFLEFAQKGSSVLAVRAASATRSGHNIERLIAEHINDAGYSTRCNIGCSEYKVDIGVIDPDDPSRYILGIMCDGNSYAMAKTASDRNLSQPDVLKGLGWRLCHVWILDWFDDKQKVINKILSAISEAIETRDSNTVIQDRSKVISELSFDKESTDNVLSGRIKKYEPYTVTPIGTSADFYLHENETKIRILMKNIIESQAPISRKTLFKTVLASFGITRSTSKADAYLTDILGTIKCTVTKSNNSAFLWGANATSENMDYFRVPDGEKRPMDDICAEEIANAALYVLERQFTLTRVDLTREVARCFGYTRTTAAMESSITEGILLCKSRGLISISSETGKISLC